MRDIDNGGMPKKQKKIDRQRTARIQNILMAHLTNQRNGEGTLRALSHSFEF